MRGFESLSNHLLIAMPSLRDPNFARGVIYVCQHGEDGAMGLVINRLSEYRLGDVLAQMGIQTDLAEVRDAPVLLGGPVQPERGFVLHEVGGEWESSFRICDEVCVTTSRDVLIAMADGRGPRRALVALGYAGWTAGQLEQELLENAWLTVAAQRQLLFDTALEDRWDAAAALVGVTMAKLTDYFGHA